jgi:hypothetical protein
MTGRALSNGFFAMPQDYKCSVKPVTLLEENMEDHAKEILRTPREELDHNFKEAYRFWRKVAESGARLPEVEMAWNLYCAARDMRLFSPNIQATYKKVLT